MVFVKSDFSFLLTGAQVYTEVDTPLNPGTMQNGNITAH